MTDESIGGKFVVFSKIVGACNEETRRKFDMIMNESKLEMNVIDLIVYLTSCMIAMKIIPNIIVSIDMEKLEADLERLYEISDSNLKTAMSELQVETEEAIQ